MRTASQAFYLAIFSLLSASHAGSKVTTRARASEPHVCENDPSMIVSDACASFSTLDALNADLTPALKSITQTTDFFAYYRLNLFHRVCPFWSEENGMCGNIACAVNTLDNQEDIPEIWRAEQLGKLEGPKAEHPGRKQQRERPEKPLQGELGEDVGESCVVEYDDECDERDYCVPEDERASAKGDYVSLLDNPERFTGYDGVGAHQVWDAIYRENCFSKPLASDASRSVAAQPFGTQASVDLKSVFQEHGRLQAAAKITTGPAAFEPDGECLEKRVFYRVISGMHASISTHLCWDHLDRSTGRWGPNLECYKSRLHPYADRISNLYFNYALLVRAVTKIRPLLAAYTFCSGDAAQDVQTKRKVLALADRAAAGPSIFDESLMFSDSAAGPLLKEDFRSRFRNVSRLMDCVGCDKCRLWGKLQTAGYGTALKVLFEYDGADSGATTTPPPLQLRRTELVALVNTLDRVSASLSAVSKFRQMMSAVERSAALREKLNLSQGADASPARDRDGDGAGADDDEGEREEDEDPLFDLFWDEWYRVWRTYKYVLSSWLATPKIILQILLIEMTRLWDYWLGRSLQPRNWNLEGWKYDEL
ncbi:MAG: hypothetical protein M1825_000678 [Sarcosagium campestre]|nr:MAG: hypothetical protein M1825_000678 [Sarcosagium campestre]